MVVEAGRSGVVDNACRDKEDLDAEDQDRDEQEGARHRGHGYEGLDERVIRLRGQRAAGAVTTA
jgi:hypothetical protein